MKVSKLPSDAIKTKIANLYACPNGDIYSFRMSINVNKPNKPKKEIIGKLTPHKAGHGYYTIRYCGKQYSHHRIIAQTFIPNPKNKETVNHKDFDKSNNSVKNLEWMTKSENSTHAYRAGKLGLTPGKRKAIKQFDLDNNFIKEFASSIEVNENFGFPAIIINRAARGERKTAYGYIWKYT